MYQFETFYDLKDSFQKLMYMYIKCKLLFKILKTWFFRRKKQTWHIHRQTDRQTEISIHRDLKINRQTYRQTDKKDRGMHNCITVYPILLECKTLLCTLVMLNIFVRLTEQHPDGRVTFVPHNVIPNLFYLVKGRSTLGLHHYLIWNSNLPL